MRSPGLRAWLALLGSLSPLGPLPALGSVLPLRALLVTALFSIGCGTGTRERRPDQIVLVTIDTLRADHLGCYGDREAETPVLDALARESLVWDDVTSAVPVTLPSHATILTGLTPPAHGVRANGSFRLAAGVQTLPEILKARGLATAGFVGAYILHREFGLDQGFDLYDDHLPAASKSLTFEFAERRAGEVLARAGDWAVSKKDAPFFLWAHLFDPHAPYDPPPPFDARFKERPYDGEIASVDHELGEFLGRLRLARILDRALLIVTSDHGEGLGDHGEPTHGLLLYQSTLRVPLIVRPPGGASRPARIAEPAGLVDLAPSILAAAGISASAPMEGRPIPGFPGAPSRPGSGYYIENLMPFHYFGWAGLRGFHEGRRKLILGSAPELYDLEKDPGETHDLAVSDRETLAALTEKTERATQEAEALAGREEGQPHLSEEALERLRSLGYASPAGRRRRPVWGSGADPRQMIGVFDRIDRAQHLIASGETAEALAILESLAAQGPPCLAVLNLLGQLDMTLGRTDAALEVLLRARELDPSDYEIRRRIAEAHYAKGEFEAALGEAREALRLNDRNAESRSILGAALARLGRIDEAIASFRQAQAVRPEEAGLHYNLGLVLEIAARKSDAEEEYRKAIALDAASAPARAALGKLLLARGDVAAARAQLEEAVRLEPQNGASREQLGIALARSGDSSGALAQLDRAAALDPARAEVQFNRGLVLEGMGRRAEAAAAFRLFLARWKGDPGAASAARQHLERLGM